MNGMKRLRALRNERGLLQTDVAKKLNIAAATLARYESGDREPSLKVLNQLADFYGVSSDYILGRTDEPGSMVPPRPPDDPQMVFAASLKDGMSYEDLNPMGKAELYDYFQYLRKKYPRDD